MTDIDPRPRAARHPCPSPFGRQRLEHGATAPLVNGDHDGARPRRTTGADAGAATGRSLACSDCNLAFGRHLHLHVDPVAAKVGGVRGSVRAALSSWGCPPQVIDDSVLLTSELVGNAVMHGPRTSITVNLLQVGDRLLLEVTDASSARPAVRQSGPEDEQGRGMYLVQAIASAWGSRRESHGGKTTWCTVALDGGGDPPRPPR
ncbi:ATP-binding protein [Streptomyces sp. NPDC002309]